MSVQGTGEDAFFPRDGGPRGSVARPLQVEERNSECCHARECPWKAGILGSWKSPRPWEETQPRLESGPFTPFHRPWSCALPHQGGGEAVCMVGRAPGDQRAERWRTTGTLDGLPDRPRKQRRATLFVDVSAQGREPPRGTLNGLRGDTLSPRRRAGSEGVCVSPSGLPVPLALRPKCIHLLGRTFALSRALPLPGVRRTFSVHLFSADLIAPPRAGRWGCRGAQDTHGTYKEETDRRMQKT